MGHTEWCAADHRCGLGEHRSESIVVDLPGHARAVLTRARDAQGRDVAEIRLRVALSPTEPVARRQLRVLLSGLRDLVTLAARPLAARRKESVR